MLEKPPPTLWGAGGPSRRLANCWRPSDDFGRLNADDRRATPGPAALLGERSLHTERRAISRQFGWRAQNLKPPPHWCAQLLMASLGWIMGSSSPWGWALALVSEV